MKKLALFDLDGTLFDTSEVNYKAYQQALEELGYNIEHDYYVSYCNGRHYTVFLPKIVHSSNDMEIIHKKKKKYYHNYLKYARINHKLFDIIKKLKRTYYIAIVTTASLDNTNDILKYFDVYELFDKVITPVDYKKTKPDPEPFLVAMKMFSVSPNDTIIFEDSEVGIESAIKSGATVLRIEKF